MVRWLRKKVSENVWIIVMGCELIVFGFVYTGSFSRAFGRGKPDYPPTLQGRITLWTCGLLFVVVGTIRLLNGY